MKKLIFFAIALAACTPDFQDETTVVDLRMLAVVAQPAEILVEAGALATLDQLPRAEDIAPLLATLAQQLPDSFPSILLEAVLVEPRVRPVHYRAVVCVSPPGSQPSFTMRPGGARDTIGRGQCGDQAPVIGEGDEQPAANGVVALYLGLEVTKEMLIAAVVADPLGAVYGLPLTVEVTASAGEGDTREEIIGRKRVLFTPRLAPDQVPNENPLILQVGFRRGEGEPLQPFDMNDPLANPPQVHLGETLLIEPAVGVKESYPTRIGDRTTGRLSTQMVTEALRYAYFTSAGSFSPARTNTEPPIIRGPRTAGVESHYHAPRELPPGASEQIVWLWIVVRDERAGQSYAQVALRLVP